MRNKRDITVSPDSVRDMLFIGNCPKSPIYRHCKRDDLTANRVFDLEKTEKLPQIWYFTDVCGGYLCDVISYRKT
ncbi:MAG: hypothetical protein LBS09_01785 [Bacteroidales bacterium]|jgi:hypothetical protein|nr:hypothetical protein [Bacteroidales bacterium]